LSYISIGKSQLRICQLWCFVTQLNEDSDNDPTNYQTPSQKLIIKESVHANPKLTKLLK